MRRAEASVRACPTMGPAVARRAVAHRASVRQSRRALATSDRAVSRPRWAGSQARSDRPRWLRRPASSRPASAPGRPVAASSSSPSLRRHDCHHRVQVRRGRTSPGARTQAARLFARSAGFANAPKLGGCSASTRGLPSATPSGARTGKSQGAAER